MALKAKNEIIWAARTFKPGEILDIPEDIAEKFKALGWAEEDAPKEAPKKATKKK